jgi:polysaccharide biosynthesis protein PslH
VPLVSGRKASPDVLFLTCHLPYPPLSGGRRREYELLRRICAELEVELYAVCKTPEDFEHAAALAEHCAHVRLFPSDPIARLDELAAIDRFAMHRSRLLTAAVRSRLAHKPMLVHVEGSFLMQHLPGARPVPTVLVEQNIESSLWRQRADSCDRETERQRRLTWLRRTEAAESECWARANLCVAVSDFDAAEIRRRSGREVLLVPDGGDHLDGAGPAAERRGDTVAMISNFGYEPNVDAARYLLDEIFPSVRRAVPDARLFLIGNAPPDDLVRRSGADGLVVTGRVDSVTPYRDEAAAIIAPHRVGGGVKVQVLEAIARGKALIASEVALQGLPPRARAELESVDGAEATVAAIVAVLADRGEVRRLEARSRLAAARLPSWDDAAEALLDGYRRVISEAAASAA